MTLRQCVRCLLCGQKHILRIAIGHGARQEHTIHCEECGEEFSVALDLDQANAGWTFNCVSNCEQTSEGGVVVNLHPEFLVPPELRNIDDVSINILACQAMMKDRGVNKFISEESDYKEALKRSREDYGVEGEWVDLKRCWSQLNKGNRERATELVGVYGKKYADTGCSPESWIFPFVLRSISPGQFFLFENAIKRVAEAIKKDESRTEAFLEFHSTRIFSANLKRYFSIFEKFFSAYSDYSAHFFGYKFGNFQPGGAVSSCKFGDTMYFYGNAFEAIGSNMTTLACLNNLLKGRKYGEFQTEGFKIEQYMSSDKSGRADCFADIPEFAALADKYTSSVRNGSHHGTFELDEKTMNVSYTPRKTMVVETISYSGYIDMCVSMFFTCAVMTGIDCFLWNITKK